MGCGASKQEVVTPSVTKKAAEATSESIKSTCCGSCFITHSILCTCLLTFQKMKIPYQKLLFHLSHLTRLVFSIPNAAQSIAFEIPLDDLLSKEKSQSTGTISSKKLALPALSLSQQDIQAKLANSEERWKVGAQLDHLLYGVR
jgi:hypothetical protein